MQEAFPIIAIREDVRVEMITHIQFGNRLGAPDSQSSRLPLRIVE